MALPFSTFIEKDGFIFTSGQVHLGPDGTLVGETIEEQVAQVMNNLLSNALKFTHAGEVAVHISSREVDGAVAVTATVDDSGPGIPADDLIAAARLYAGAKAAAGHNGRMDLGRVEIN